MPEDHFGEEIAARYDDPSDEMFQAAAIEPVVDFLAALADDGAALELGIGTGRIALPLAQRGVEVHGIDLSSAMVARLRAKPGGDGIPVAIGDFATARADALTAKPALPQPGCSPRWSRMPIPTWSKACSAASLMSERVPESGPSCG